MNSCFKKYAILGFSFMLGWLWSLLMFVQPVNGFGAETFPFIAAGQNETGLNVAPQVLEPTETIEVYVGIYLVRIASLSLKNNEYRADFYLWFRWKDERFKPYETFELMNGTIENKTLIEESMVQGWNYAVFRIRSSITKYWDVVRFPFDHHTITLEIEDSVYTDNQLKYIPDTENCGVDTSIEVSGFVVRNPQASLARHSYKTNYGKISDPSGMETFYSRFIFSLQLQRPGVIHALKMFYGVFMAVVIAFSCLFVRPLDLTARFGLSASAIFAVIGSHFVVINNMPESQQLTLVDRLHIFSGLTILATIVVSIISLALWVSGREKESKRFDRISFTVLLLIYLSICVNAFF